MQIVVHLILALCTLHQLIDSNTGVNASKLPWKNRENSVASKRKIRAVNKPIPINCQLGRWSSWTPCTSCTDKKYRARHVEKPSQFGGIRCLGMLWEKQLCPDATTQCLVDDYCGESFTCKQSGRCIHQALRCNGITDCYDNSDEEDCQSFNERDDKCSRLMPIPGAERGTQGYNLLTGEFVSHVLDPKYFGGECEYVYNGEWRRYIYDAFCESLHYNDEEKNYRKPYNYHTYHFVAEAESQGSQEFYEDMASLVNARKTLSSSSMGVTVGVYNVEVGISASQESEFFNNITQYKSQDLGFIRLSSKVQTARFKLRSNKLMLHEELLMSLMELPEIYDYGMYSHFINTFGTHYVTEGIMGGTLEYIAVVNKTAMAQSNVGSEKIGGCIGGSFGLSIPAGSQGSVDLKLKANHCDVPKTTSGGGSSSSSMIKDRFILIKGGMMGTSNTALLTGAELNTHRKWGASLQYNPALIENEIMPIYELLRVSTASDHVGVRIANLEQAVDEYLHQFDPCRCAPCRHNGIPVLSGTSCSCICKSGFLGDACEETLRPDAKTDGSWSCWAAWSTCTSGQKRRTRVCNNPLPDRGGSTCVGSSSQTRRC